MKIAYCNFIKAAYNKYKIENTKNKGNFEMAKILVTAEIIQSKPDVSGNIYTGLVAIRTEDGAAASGLISGGESNCTYALNVLTGGNWGHRFHYVKTEVSKREFNRIFKKGNLLGCTEDEINKNIIELWEEDSKKG